VQGKEIIDFQKDEEVNFYVDELFNKMLKEKRIDIVGFPSKSKKKLVDFESIENKNVREFGAENMAHLYIVGSKLSLLKRY
jgi:hypothetical protein